MKAASHTAKNHTNKTTHTLPSPAPLCLSFSELEALCDDPKRNETGEEVQPVLTRHLASYLLSVRDGATTYEIVETGRQVRFKTIEAAQERLSDVPYLLTEIIVTSPGKPTAH